MPNTTFFKDWQNAQLLTPSTAATLGANRFLALFTTTPTEGAAGTEVTGGSYARVQVLSASIGTASGTTTRSISNTALITFPEPTASWGTVTHIGVYDASTGGNFLSFFDMADFTALTGITPYIPIGNLTSQQGNLA